MSFKFIAIAYGMLGATAAAVTAPPLTEFLPGWAVLAISAGAAMAVAALWSLLPALLKARHGVNEIVTTLMMSFLGLSLANALVKLVFLDPGTTVPQTRTLAVASTYTVAFRVLKVRRQALAAEAAPGA